MLAVFHVLPPLVVFLIPLLSTLMPYEPTIAINALRLISIAPLLHNDTKPSLPKMVRSLLARVNEPVRYALALVIEQVTVLEQLKYILSLKSNSML